MKGFTRYYRDPDFKLQVDEQFALAREVTRPGVWITYAIHDPTEVDSVGGRAQGSIRYVGQTKNFGNRVKKRMSTAGRAVGRPTDNIDGLLWDVMSRGPAPRWSVLEEVGSAIESLVSETNWVIDLRAQGYPLVNQWSENKHGTQKVSRYNVDPKRLWQITTEDAIGSNVGLSVRDPVSGQEVHVDLSIYPRGTRLYKIRDHARQSGRRARIVIN
ncbi:hypothetical protein [Tsuneonella rigui]|uniref:hypothetical protein n=1 Tax=Tsuneonella rigui TaxID=1708790 RepID=UPI000F7EE834|nr:hypothetical protein [Tsuneonella rigui]